MIYSMSGAIVMAMLYWQILAAKYHTNYHTKSAFYQINYKIESVLSRVPAALNVYRKITGYLYSMVDPARLQQQQQAAAGGGGGGGAGAGGMLGNLASRCVIM